MATSSNNRGKVDDDLCKQLRQSARAGVRKTLLQDYFGLAFKTVERHISGACQCTPDVAPIDGDRESTLAELPPETVKSETMAALYERPRPAIEVSSGVRSTVLRQLVAHLKAPRKNANTGTSKSRPGGSNLSGVVYLYGDERQAVREFVRCNEAFVRDCLTDRNNPLNESWDEGLYRLLVEEFQLYHHYGGGDA